MERAIITGILARLGNLFTLLAEGQSWPGFSSGLTEEEYDSLQLLIRKEQIHNPWFTETSIRFALGSLGAMLDEKALHEWASGYSYSDRPKRVAIIMAGNIPLVGFHDFVCVLLSGNTAVCKLSSDDLRLLPAFVQVLTKWEPAIAERIVLAAGPIKQLDAVLATGSDNSAGYFHEYFGKYPHIFRKNRTSVAVLDGTETPEELRLLGDDLFRFFGLGCRNVSKIFLPESFDGNRVFEAIVGYGEVINHHKYANNYDYNRTVYLMNSIPFLDNNFALFREDEGLFSPLSVFFTQRYKKKEEVADFLTRHADSIQAVVGHGYLPFGTAQQPALDDYADGVDTMAWLATL